ncbi:PEP-CTERM protein-sorting domain-containing protein [Rubritalea squalenifaciens DSM 18772]|uniref:PEP-CTERM protein-sorting domain-containing protein n=1 Tax=Rubritalea squalenifaciens DSM 18772 TaxID=1123071 RepID=A0A1M6SCX3_9BACT|nr:PEP-CTERM sorting domain-containing protein [Rubritalea squalenifaciens]SHK42509.1 PEP-CTERM protein-sorting domain-containing protein [Rubritalea squalenifaciens DSM 18772]
MKYPHLLPLLACTLGSAQAATTLLDVQLSRTEAPRSEANLGTVGITTFNAGNPGPASQTITYTITGLTLDSVGSGDDEVVITMGIVATSTSGAVTGIGAAFGAWGVEDGTGTASLVDPDEALSFSITAASVNLGAGAFETAEINFDGFTGFAALNVGAGETFNIANTNSNDVTNFEAAPLPNDPDEGAANIYTFTGTEDSFTVEGNTGAMRYAYITGGFTIDTIPEPSSTSLLGLAGLSLILRRKR